MNVYMTRIPGVPDRLNDVKPGMAWYCGTGPRGKTCGDCEFRTYPRDVQVPAASNELQLGMRWVGRPGTTWKAVQHGGCLRFKQLSGRDGPAIKKSYPACREFKEKEEPNWKRW